LRLRREKNRKSKNNRRDKSDQATERWSGFHC
jgi:hypothetical protein